jgi:hypothetical protein
MGLHVIFRHVDMNDIQELILKDHNILHKSKRVY